MECYADYYPNGKSLKKSHIFFSLPELTFPFGASAISMDIELHLFLPGCMHYLPGIFPIKR
ncbi:hypothetical protein [Bacillus nakamurai]|uniref:hypothetical protein n=1 Tax=Bacillus nakamurai TaxID=1793963 RepID=UPI0020C48AEC|nr:hypothetical protein [Bacillus nakamurai]MCP6680647.1 hypothetical protein [Bacillus nakamurai]